jgi:hypothetical protein
MEAIKMLELTEDQIRRWVLHRFIKKCIPEVPNDESIIYIIKDVLAGKTDAEIKEENHQIRQKTINKVREAIQSNDIYAHKFREVFLNEVSSGNLETKQKDKHD